MKKIRIETWKTEDLRDENLADYSIQRIASMASFNKKHGRHAQMITVTPEGVILAGTPIHRANQLLGIEEVEVNVVDVADDEIQHTRLTYDAVPENYKSFIPMLVEAHRYYKAEGAPYREEHGKEGEVITEFLGRHFCGWSHESVRKAIVIGKSKFADDLTNQMDETDAEKRLSLDAAYHRLKEVEESSKEESDVEENDVEECEAKPKRTGRSRGLIGGNTPEFELTDDDTQMLKSLFDEESCRLHETVSSDELPVGCSLKINRSRNGEIESYSCTYKTIEGTFTAFYVPDKVKKQNK